MPARSDGRPAERLAAVPDPLVEHVTGTQELGTHDQLGAAIVGPPNQRLGVFEVALQLPIVGRGLDGGDGEMAHALRT